MIESVLASETSRYIAGIVGSILSLQYASYSAKWYERVFMTATGVATAVYMAPAAQHYLNLSDEYTLGLAFVAGMYGWSVTGGIFKILRAPELQSIILNIFRGRQ